VTAADRTDTYTIPCGHHIGVVNRYYVLYSVKYLIGQELKDENFYYSEERSTSTTVSCDARLLQLTIPI